jgi:hypothetical protein
MSVTAGKGLPGRALLGGTHRDGERQCRQRDRAQLKGRTSETASSGWSDHEAAKL